MFGSKRKEFGLSGLCLALLALLLIVSGCDTTSDPIQSFEATGSWQGTIGANRVRGIIAPPDEKGLYAYQLAIVDANGDFIPGAGEYIGKMILVDRENSIGRMSMTYLHPPDNAVLTEATFKVGASLLYSEDAPIALNRTGDAAPGLYTQAAVEGHWSLTLSDTDNLTAAVIDAAGNLHGNDNDACQYSGTLQLMDATWNIFQLDLTFSNLPGKDCRALPSPSYKYRGLAMPLTPEGSRRRIWLAANVWETSLNRTDTYFGNWAETVNVAPVAKMTANTIPLVEGVDLPLKVKQFTGTVKLGAQLSSDANKDVLTYQWSGKDPDGAPIFEPSVVEGVEVTFTPKKPGVYTLQLTANDGLLDSAPTERKIAVEWVANRFVDCQNGTVLDTSTNLFWLKDAGCPDLHDPVNGWVDLSDAKGNVAGLAASVDASVCGLSDGSVAGDWRLPLLPEFETIIDVDGSHSTWNAPALVNGLGDAQWTPGDVFDNVGQISIASFAHYYYWTSEPADPGRGIYVNFDWRRYPPLSVDGLDSTINSVWPVRDEISAVAGDEVNACLQAAAQPN